MSSFAQDTGASMRENLSALSTYQYYMLLLSSFPFHQSQTLSEGAKPTDTQTADGVIDDATNKAEATESWSSKVKALSTEILLNIISFIDDIPSVVVFALTTRRHYVVTLGYFKVNRLNQICPKDVRSRFPPKLEQFAYNTLKREGRYNTRWHMENQCFPAIASTQSVWPGLSSLDQCDKLCVLSLVRRMKWLAKSADAMDDFSADDMDDFSDDDMDGFSPDSHIREARVKIPGVCTVWVSSWAVKMHLDYWWVVQSVEYLVLRRLLKDWCFTVKGYGLNRGYWRYVLMCVSLYPAFVLGMALVWGREVISPG